MNNNEKYKLKIKTDKDEWQEIDSLTVDTPKISISSTPTVTASYILNNIYSDCLDSMYNLRLGGEIECAPDYNIPKRYIVNDNAAILFWDDEKKTIVKRAKDDKVDVIKSFLWAYFLKQSGMSRTKANKYLENIYNEYKKEGK